VKRLRKVATEMTLNVLAYNLKRVLAILGCQRIDGGNVGMKQARPGEKVRCLP
jgi:hypothetical protein